MANDCALNSRNSTAKILIVAALVSVGAISIAFPTKALETFEFVAISLLQVSPLVIPGILIAAWVSASGAGSRIAEVFNGNLFKTIVAASLIGAVTPVCGVTVLPLMAGLLAAGVPLAPVMAFWLSSPVTDPAMLATTAATLGMSFAIGKTLAAMAMGLFGGGVTALLINRSWAQSALRDNALVGSLGRVCQADEIEWAVWRSPKHRTHFRTEFIAISRLVLICLIPAFAAEFVLQSLLEPQALSSYVGGDVWWAIPLAVFVGAPAYLDGYAALPLTRSLMDHGMSSGAAMAFLVSGGVVSIWGAMAIFPVLKLKPFLLYLSLAVTGSMAAGWIFGLVV
ncbi:permease [Roseibium sp. RKSG952]|uniref:permease n=1 Tax=Roseibium sp. RKSG952 TaxID=2529384 RepID=UPI0012BD377C|nr:permease [Roseibium sp. RKSG952]MTI02235.1 permease [Roseibium sp. RKSG952]